MITTDDPNLVKTSEGVVLSRDREGLAARKKQKQSRASIEARLVELEKANKLLIRRIEELERRQNG
jgi:hypothetical protein